MRIRSVAATYLVGLVLATFSGCSLSDSSSKIISSPFESLSASSTSSSKGAETYRAAVRDYTEAHLRSSADPTAFQVGLAKVAKDNGISDWQSDPNTYLGIGAGLKKAKVTADQLEVYKRNWSGGDASRAANIQKGYDSEK